MGSSSSEMIGEAKTEIRLPPLPKLEGPNDGVADKGGDCLTFSIALYWEDGTRTKSFMVPLRVEPVRGGIKLWPVDSLIATIPNPKHKTAEGIWFYLNGVPWHFADDWEWNNPAENPIYVTSTDALVDLS